MSSRKAGQWFLAGITCWAATGVLAQHAAPPSAPLDTLPRPALPSQPGGDVQVEVQRPAAPADALLQSRLTPRKFDIAGVKSIPFDEVAALFTPLVGQSVTVNDLVERSQRATSLYQKRGYALSFFFVPQQDFKDGVVRVVAVEGHIQTLRIEGAVGAAETMLRDMVEPLRHETPLRTATFEHVIALLGRLPGVGIQAQVQPPTSTDGASNMVLHVRRKNYDVAAGLEARKPTPRAVVTAVMNDPILPGSQLGVSTLLSTADHDSFNALHYEQFVGSKGWSVKGSVSQYRGDPNEQLGVTSALDRRTEVDRAELTATLPLRLSRTMGSVVSTGFYGVDTRDRLTNPDNGAWLTDESRVRALFVQWAYSEQQADDSQQLNLKLTHGIKGLGANAVVTSNVPGLGGPSSVELAFAKLQFEASRSHRFANQIGTTASLGIQVSPDSLPSSEKVSFGGSRFARGYSPGAGVGDSGWGVGLELNRAFAYDSFWLRQWQPYLLLENARVYNRFGTPAPERLRSQSLGLRLTNHKQYSLDLAVSRPLGDRTPDNPERHWRASLALSYRLGD